MNEQRLNLVENPITKTVSFNGFEFDYLSSRWKLNRNATVNLNTIQRLETQTRETVIEGLVYFAEMRSAKHTSNIAEHLSKYIRDTGENSFTEQGLLAFKTKLGKKEEYKLAVIRGFIRQLRFLGIQGPIQEGVYTLIDKWRLSGNEKGVAVLSFDPEIGPFSQIEFEAIGHALAHKYAEQVITTEQYVIIQLYKATGRRSEQIASLKCKDFSLSNKHTGSTTYVVNIPRIKQRGAKFRQLFKPFGLINSIGQVIESHIQQLTKRVESALGRKLSVVEVGELPLFLPPHFIADLRELEQSEHLKYLQSELCHFSSSAIGYKLVSAVNRLNVTSERTGKRLNVIPYRFRYTLGSRAATEGAGILTIATLLDQNDTQNTDVYVRNVPEFAIEISKIMNQPLARYASAFKGKVVLDEKEANTQKANAARIPFREKDCDLGSCGTNTFCQDYAPVACYVCPKFMPWVDAPHHLILQSLIEERERLKEQTDNDMQVVSINDRVIVAVCQVIKLVEESKACG